MRNGFTVLELLIALAIIGLLAALGLLGLSRSLAQTREDQITSELAQTITGLRNKALRTGVSQQIVLTDTGYTVTPLDHPDQAQTTTTPLHFSPVGVPLTCTSKGFCTATDALGQPTTLNRITAQGHSRTRTISLTLLGLTRVQ